MSGGMFLCWGCQHTFPESIVEKIDISEDLEGHFNCVQARLARLRDMRPQTGAERLRRTVAELEADFRQLVLAVRKDARLLKEERELLAMERRDLEERQRDGAQNGMWADAASPLPAHGSTLSGNAHHTPRVPAPPSRSVISGTPAPPADASAADDQHGSAGGGVTAGALRRRLFTVKGGLPEDRRALTNRFQKEVYSGTGGYGRADTCRATHGPATAAAQALAALYLCVESMVSHCAAAAGRLWCRCAGAGVISADGDELSCIITVGSEQSSTDAAQRCAAAQGTVGAAVTTGIALNLGVPEHFATASDGHVTPPRSDDDGDEHVSFNLLCFPVAAKYRAFARRVPEGSEGNWRGSGCIGALQLINKNGGETPFSAADEAACLGACAVISHVLSNYRSALSGAASKKVFDAGPLRKAAAFVATSGSQARKAVPMMEAVEAHQPSQLIYRCSRQQVRATRKGDMLSTRCEVAVANRIKDMQREHVLHEIAYKKCVKEKEEQKSQKEELAEQLIQLRRDLMDARSQGSRRLSLSANPGAGEQKGKSRERGGAPRKSAFIDSGLGASIAVASGADRTPRHLSATVPAGRRPSFV
eukprot:TRINITY_DN17480_c0_g1_i2.p1 TRINITY_DN17480_c0_g1~~TRINITY_DN17480_c0_g1_i2.p1  ORF type:complete len:592 (+),score=126.89 TRINITY_DN17480_c0_g1_i2:98-1873(+)